MEDNQFKQLQQQMAAGFKAIEESVTRETTLIKNQMNAFEINMENRFTQLKEELLNDQNDFEGVVSDQVVGTERILFNKIAKLEARIEELERKSG